MARAITLKKALVVIGITALLGMAYALYTWYKPQRDARKEEGIALTAQVLIDAYRSNEQEANAKYLDKTLIVSGEVLKVSVNQEGQKVVELKTSSPDATIFCSISANETNAIKAGEKVQLKGICKGYRDQIMMVDVVLQDCYIIME
jgi:type II secretory pathway pseudopilin PulG